MSMSISHHVPPLGFRALAMDGGPSGPGDPRGRGDRGSGEPNSDGAVRQTEDTLAGEKCSIISTL